MKIENQDRIILAFLEKVAKRVEEKTGIKGWECLVDEDPFYDEYDVGVYIIGNKSFDSSLIVEVNVEPEKIFICIYNHNSAFFGSIFESIKEELPKVAKELKIKDWEIIW